MNTALKLASNRRNQQRDKSAAIGLVSCVIKIGAERLTCDVVNYHFDGACLQVPHSIQTRSALRLGNKLNLDFRLGENSIKTEISAEVIWEDIKAYGMIGIRFLSDERTMLRTAERAACHGVFRPSLDSLDPVDAHRKIFFHVVDVSLHGMLITTSMTNKHLFPGMTLRGAKLRFPDQDAVDVELFIENTRPSELATMFYLGVSVKNPSVRFQEGVRNYLAILAPVLSNSDSRDEGKWKPKQIRGGLSYKVISIGDQVEYEKLLKLRFLAYKSHDKVKEGTDWSGQATDQDSQGIIICAYLGGQMVASLELLFGSENPDFRMFRYAPGLIVPELDVADTVEINKLVIHPGLQGSDAVVGMFQKCHGILVAKGGRDVVVSATDKLTPLYLRLGFIKLSQKISHPYLPDQPLNLLLLKKDVYLQGKFLSPGTWAFVYHATHEHMERLGLTSYGSKQKAMHRIGWVLAKIIPIRRSVRKILKGPKSQNPERMKAAIDVPNRSTGFVDPKWTSQHMVASIIRPYLFCADEMIGAEHVNRILGEIGLDRSYFEGQANWVSVGFLDAFVEKFSLVGNAEELSKKAGERSLSKEMIGLNYYVLKHFATPQLAFKSFVSVARKFNLSRTYTLKNVSECVATVSLGVSAPELLPKNPASCLNWQANFNSYIRIMTGKDAKITKTNCCYTGGDACTWEIGWEPRKRITPISLALSYCTAILLLVMYGANGKLSVESLGYPVALGALLIHTVYSNFTNRQSRGNAANQLAEFERSQTEAVERYRELQVSKGVSEQRYQEAKFFEKTLEEILNANEVSRILEIALDAACRTFGFDRAFVMLADDDTKVLKTAMVRVSNPDRLRENYDLLRHFSVDISKKRDSSLVVSSVFHTRVPVLIDDAEAHLFQLNAESRKLVLKLRTKGFVMVAIPRREDAWGVIIADKTEKGKKVDKSDLVLLQRIGQHIGLALSKQADLNREVNLRRGFEKYVPQKIVDDASANVAPRLGGQQKEIISLFFDIRDYTAFSSLLQPQVTIELLNKVFTMVQGVVSKYDGLVDKFLGDGVMITWGSIGGSAPNAGAAVNCALDILGELVAINDFFEESGLPRISVGMGIDKGLAVCGNIGSQTRMEFTSIGSTVNLSSRLEGLCKSKSATIIISQSILAEAKSQLDDRWKFETNVAVRGLANPVSIGIYQ
jgi:class 3 adenylate cyclase